MYERKKNKTHDTVGKTFQHNLNFHDKLLFEIKMNKKSNTINDNNSIN